VALGLFVGGSLCSFVSQIVERYEYDAHDQRVAGYQHYVVVEEVLELAGSVLIATAFIHAGRRALGRGGQTVSVPTLGVGDRGPGVRDRA
jgi:hypothetical protein